MKTRSLIVLAAFGLLAGSGRTPAGDASKEDAVRKELTKFEGTWKLVSMEMDGNKVPEEGLKEMGKMILRGNKFTVPVGDITHRGTFRVDVSAKPKRIDVTFTEGPEKGKTLLGIYELEGDTYKVCIGEPGKPRPKEFVAKKGSGHVLEIFKRQKARRP
jgi:uncharacterized protein (TIGR03067 family)